MLNPKNFKPLPRISEAVSTDDLRPILSHAFITKEHIVASEARILVRLKTREFFDEAFVENIPLSGLFVDIYTLRALQRPGIKFVTCITGMEYEKSEKLVKIEYWRGETVYYPLKTHVEGSEKYPDVDELIRDRMASCKKAISTIGINGRYMLRLQQALGSSRVQLFFESKEKGMYVVPVEADLKVEGREGLLMPVMID